MTVRTESEKDTWNGKRENTVNAIWRTDALGRGAYIYHSIPLFARSRLDKVIGSETQGPCDFFKGTSGLK